MIETKNPTQGGSPVLRKSALHNYQLRAIQHIVDTHKCALFLEMGL